MAVLKIDREEVKGLLITLGAKSAAKWDDARILGKLTALDGTDDTIEPGKYSRLYKKIVRTNNKDDGEFELIGGESESVEEMPKVTKPRKRGRPAKAKAAEEPAEVETEETESPKRKRKGRKAKPVPEVEEVAEESEPAKPRKRRGRPAKEKTDTEPETETKPARRKRGRPAKAKTEPADVETEETEETAKPKKRRGRPAGKASKKEKPEKEKLPRGRTETVGRVVREMVMASSVKNPVTKAEIHKRLVKEFPERDATGMLASLNVMLPSRLKTDLGVEIAKSGKNYWVVK